MKKCWHCKKEIRGRSFNTSYIPSENKKVHMHPKCADDWRDNNPNRMMPLAACGDYSVILSAK